jgi:hypothetical protein
MRLLAVGVLATSVLVGGCTEPSTVGDEGNESPSPAAPTLDPEWGDSMTVTPATASPGQRVALRFSPPMARGTAFSLAGWGEEGWTVAYHLTSDWGSPGGHDPDWWSVEDSEGRGWVDVGIGGPGPDHVVVPSSARAGEYLLCTANAADEACALVVVTG